MCIKRVSGIVKTRRARSAFMVGDEVVYINFIDYVNLFFFCKSSFRKRKSAVLKGRSNTVFDFQNRLELIKYDIVTRESTSVYVNDQTNMLVQLMRFSD